MQHLQYKFTGKKILSGHCTFYLAAIWHYFPVARCAETRSLHAPSLSLLLYVCLSTSSHYISVMTHVAHHWVSQEWPWIAPDNITAGWQCFLCLWLCADLAHLHKITDPTVPNVGDNGAEKENESWEKNKRCRINGRQSNLLFKEQYSNREVRNEDRGRAVWKENNSQLLRRRMPWLQTDWAINRLIIYSLLIASVRGPSVLSHWSPQHLVS